MVWYAYFSALRERPRLELVVRYTLIVVFLLVVSLTLMCPTQTKSDDNHATADDRKVDLYSIGQRCHARIEVYIHVMP